MTNGEALDLYNRGEISRWQFLDTVEWNKLTDQEKALRKDCFEAMLDPGHVGFILKHDGAVLINGNWQKGRLDILWYFDGGRYERITNLNTVLYAQNGAVISLDWHHKG